MLLSLLDMLSRFLFIFGLAYYSMTLLQWYNYMLLRVINKHHRVMWHIIYFIIPLFMFFLLFSLKQRYVFYVYLYALYLPSLIYWAFSLDKRLVFTARVWRFFFILMLLLVINESLFIFFEIEWLYWLWLMPFVFALLIGKVFENTLMLSFTSLAGEKLAMMDNLIIIAITASFGKTSIKNFLTQILEHSFTVHSTPRSVNTLKGIVQDINDNLNFGTNIYVIEAGAREQGDILDIANFINPQIVVIGEIGKAHIEYFKSLENTTKTKFELLESKNLLSAFVYYKNNIPSTINEETKKLITLYPHNVRNVEATLEKTSFELEINGEWVYFETNVLGKFNVENIVAAIVVALRCRISVVGIQKYVKKLSPVPHRLNLFVSNNKTIIDDSFNGNLNGMLEGIRLCSLYAGRKVIVSPGLIESDEESNVKLAKEINRVFDLAIITGVQNSAILSANITSIQKVVLKDKNQLENVLKAMIGAGDLIYFANDAPSYI